MTSIEGIVFDYEQENESYYSIILKVGNKDYYISFIIDNENSNRIARYDYNPAYPKSILKHLKKCDIVVLQFHAYRKAATK